MDAREAAAHAEIHVRQEAMLRVAAAHSNGARIFAQDFDIDVAHPGVKRSGSGVTRPAVFAAAASRARTASGEEHHVVFILRILIARSALPEHEHGPPGPVADQADRRPDVQGLGQPVAPGRNEDHAFAASLLDLVDGLLNGCGVVGRAVAAGAAQIHRFRIVQPQRVIGCRPRSRGREHQ